jgi:2-polyprenyl-6-hydroxyphenyl methylase/3-demethylubiquinone-9 3-methyltransferase
MISYYAGKLAAERLRRCYELATPSVRRYLDGEIGHVRARIRPGDRVLELGCGYGRVLREIAPGARISVGIDISDDSLRLARAYLGGLAGTALARMDAVRLGCAPASFDMVVCVQNGISAFHADPRTVLEQAVAVTRPGGIVLFSSYAAEFWEDRLEWFRLQAAEGLVGEIDEAATGGGVIVCRDGFTATTVGPREFFLLTRGLGREMRLENVAGSSLFCEIAV